MKCLECEKRKKAADAKHKRGRKIVFDRDGIVDLRSKGKTYRQIADKLGCSVSVVHEALKKELEEL